MKSTDIKNHKTSISQTHNLEVIGSSPIWSTLKMKRLRTFVTASFSYSRRKQCGLQALLA